MGKKKISAEGYERMQARNKREANEEANKAINLQRRENIYGKQSDDTVHTQFLNYDKLEREKEAAIRDRAQSQREKEVKDSVENSRIRKVFVCGDTRGDLGKLFGTIEAQQKKVGQFDALLCVGSFVPIVDVCTNAEAAGNGLASYFSGDKQLPVDCYFIDPGATLLQAAPRGKKICEKLFFLGAYGVRECCGLRVGYLSGHYDPAVYDRLDVDFVGGAYTAKAVGTLQRLVKQKGIDVLLTCGWPAALDALIDDAAQRPPPVEGVPNWKLAAATPLAELCEKMEPRYHIFGSANLFYQRPQFKTRRRGHACRCIGLGSVGSTNKQQKWLHALQLAPMEHMKPDDLKAPAGTAECPFSPAPKRPADAGEHPDTPAAKRGASGSAAMTSEEQAAIAEEEEEEKDIRELALTSLLAGNLSAYWQEAEKLKDVPMTRDFATEAKPKLSLAEAYLNGEPKDDCVRYTFEEKGELGLHLSKDIPPWVLEVHDGHHAAKKAPKVPVGGIVIAVNGIEIKEGLNGVYSDGYQQARKLLGAACSSAVSDTNPDVRPIILDIKWPADVKTPNVKRA